MAPGMLQIIVIVLLVMVLFGTGRIPTIMENLAKGIKSFKKGLQDEDGDTSASVAPMKNEAPEASDTKTDSKAE
jgi:sec-independent protein translocase protein TatA